MKKNHFKHKLLSCLLVTAVVGYGNTAVVSASNTKSDVDSYIWGLNYNNSSILTNNGERITNIFPTYASNNNNEFVVVEKIKKNITTNSADISVMSSNEDRIYPGALLKANSGLLENNPTPISIDRSSIRLSVDLPGISNGENSKEVKKPTSSSVKSAINDLTNNWNEKYASSYPSVPAKIEYSETSVNSKEQLKAKFGLGFDKIGVPLNIDFDSVAKGEKQSLIVNLKQIYYNVSMDIPTSPSKFFGDSVTVKNLADRGLNELTPPVYVSNVSYGRSMYINMETTSKSVNVNAAFKALIKGVQIDPSSEYQKILDNTTFRAVILGGDSGEAIKVVSGDVKALKEIIQQGARYNKNNPGVAVSYRTNFVKDNSPAVLNNSSDYYETKITSYKNGELELRHRGAYIAKFYVTWDELSYDRDGSVVLTPKSWEFNGQPRTAGFTAHIPLKGNVRNLNVKITEKTGLAWEPWRTVYEKYDLPLAQKRSVTVWGTTLNPKSGEVITNN